MKQAICENCKINTDALAYYREHVPAIWREIIRYYTIPENIVNSGEFILNGLCWRCQQTEHPQNTARTRSGSTKGGKVDKRHTEKRKRATGHGKA